MIRQSIAAVVVAAALLVTSVASAEVLYRGKVYRITADTIITDRHMPCTYGRWTFDTLPNGVAVISRTKTCTQAGVTR